MDVVEVVICRCPSVLHLVAGAIGEGDVLSPDEVVHLVEGSVGEEVAGDGIAEFLTVLGLPVRDHEVDGPTLRVVGGGTAVGAPTTDDLYLREVRGAATSCSDGVYLQVCLAEPGVRGELDCAGRLGRLRGGVTRRARLHCSLQPGAGVHCPAALEAAANPHLKVQVRARGTRWGHSTVVALIGDVLAGADGVTGGNVDAVGEHVPVDGGDRFSVDGVVEHDPVPESRGWTCGGDHAIRHGIDRSAGALGDVDALVHRPPAGAEFAGHRAHASSLRQR